MPPPPTPPPPPLPTASPATTRSTSTASPTRARSARTTRTTSSSARCGSSRRPAHQPARRRPPHGGRASGSRSSRWSPTAWAAAAKGDEASRVALEAVTQYVSRSMRCYYAAGSADDQEFSDALQEGAAQCHAELLRRGEEDADYRGMATTLTLYLGVWPRAYLLQVGDSRCYLLRHGELTQITRDQTMAQELVDAGVMTGRGGGGHPAGPHALQLDRRAPDRSQGHPLRHDLGPRRCCSAATGSPGTSPTSGSGTCSAR